MLWTREEYISHMTFHGSPREMFCELFGPLAMLADEWRAAGVPEEEISLRAFGWDAVKYISTGLHFSARAGIEPRILEDNALETLSIDGMGRKMLLKKRSATIPLPIDYPVQTPEDWDRRRHWYAFDEKRLDGEWLKKVKKEREEGALVVLFMPGGFDEPRNLMGEKNLCYACYDEPEMLEDMLSAMGEMMVKSIERIAEVVPIDLLSVHEDMAGASGPLFGPRQVRELIAPYYRRVWAAARQAGATIFSQDSDGNMNNVIDAFLDAGINCMYPAEPKAGMNIRALREKYGTRLAFKGGIDKFALRGTREDIDRELDEKMAGNLLGGGTVFAIDHRIPNGVPIENYRYYVSEGRKRLGLPPAAPAEHIRMAF